MEMSSHFQSKLTEIQEQIQQHSARNDKLCQENLHLTAKLEGIVAQCELREEVREHLHRHQLHLPVLPVQTLRTASSSSSSSAKAASRWR